MHHAIQNEHAVLIAGGGPTGLMLAAELAIAKVDVAIVERRLTQDLESSRAGGLHARTLELLDQRGVVERFLVQGTKMQVASFVQHGDLDIGDFPTRHNYGLALWQKHIERTLAEWVSELGVRTYRGRELKGFTQHARGVEVTLSDRTVHAQYLVGCDGGRSLVRKLAGIAFPGWEAASSSIIAEVELAEQPASGMNRDAKGTSAMGKLDDGLVRIVLRDEHVCTHEPTLEELRAALLTLYGRDFGLRRARWLSRFSDATRQAAAYRSERVLLAGDAAHVHSPVGGQGLNLGLHDAVNLGWKLAQVVSGTSPDSLLDSYHGERHPVGARVLRNTMAMTALHKGDDRSEALRERVSELLRMEEPRKRFGAMMSGLDVHYDLGEGHPLLGRRMPDLQLDVGRVYTLLHEARPLLLRVDDGASHGFVRTVRARYDGPWELPVLGTVCAPSALLIRPDGYVAWVGAATEAGLQQAIAKWFGPHVS